MSLWVDVSWVNVAMGRCLMGRCRLTIETGLEQGSKYCLIQPSRMREHGEHREQAGHGKEGKHQSTRME